MTSPLRLVLGLPPLAHAAAAAAAIWLAETAEPGSWPGRGGWHGVALVFALAAVGRLLVPGRDAADSEAAQMRRVEAAVQVTREHPRPTAPGAAAETAAGTNEAGATETLATGPVPADSPLGRLRARRTPPGDDRGA